jgi:hypothetical protein
MPACPAPAKQTLAQSPQLASLVCALTHVPLQFFDAPAGHCQPQVDPLHSGAPPTGYQHGVQLVPQEEGELSGRHSPLQRCEPLGHAQLPSRQIIPPKHALPHVPQLSLSFKKSGHVRSGQGGSELMHPHAVSAQT